ncbi:MAG: HNH endonuclease [Chloroflexota bacterium]|nr:HNH endonuclease [Chloroflexota bacterium]
MASVLLLNATYEPLNVVSVRRAIVLLLKEKAEILEAAEQRIRAAEFSMPKPLVIRLVYYVRVPRSLKIPLTRRTLMVRDNYTCQYCGAQLPASELTMDHVVPKVRGGKTTWENVVCACKTCNARKGAKSLEEANMRLRKKPTRPEYVAVVLLSRSSPSDVWDKYLSQMSVVGT